MLRVALTGGLSSGKSAAAAMLRDLGAAVSQSDEVGRSLMQPGEPVFQAILEHFGPKVLGPSGQLDRPELARIAFGQGRVEELNAIVHPAVIAAQMRWMESIGVEDPSAVAVIESALVFETKHGTVAQDGLVSGPEPAPWRARFDRIVVVAVPEAIRKARYIERVTAGGHVKPDAATEDFLSRVSAQWTDAQRAALADFTIENSGTLDDLRGKTSRLFVVLQQAAADMPLKRCERFRV